MLGKNVQRTTHASEALVPMLGRLHQSENVAVKHVFSVLIWVFLKIMVPFLGPLNTRRPIIPRTQKGTIILTTTHMVIIPVPVLRLRFSYGSLYRFPPVWEQ